MLVAGATDRVSISCGTYSRALLANWTIESRRSAGWVIGAILLAETVLQPIVEAIFVAIFNHDADRNRRAGELGIAANMSYWGMILALLIACLIYLTSFSTDLRISALIVSLILLAALVVLEVIILRRGRIQRPKTLLQDLQWTVPALVVSLWTFALCFKAGELDWYTALFAAGIAAISVAGFVKLFREIY